MSDHTSRIERLELRPTEHLLVGRSTRSERLTLKLRSRQRLLLVCILVDARKQDRLDGWVFEGDLLAADLTRRTPGKLVFDLRAESELFSRILAAPRGLTVPPWALAIEPKESR